MDIKQEIEHIAERLKKNDGLLGSFKKGPAKAGPQPVEKGHRKVAFFLIGDSRIEGKNAV